MAQSEPIELTEDGDVAAAVAGMFGSKELRALASNAGVSRERGDTKGETARRLVEQDPALAARVVENAHPLDAPADCSAFREEREVGDGPISLDEAKKRARHKGMRHKLESLERALAAVPNYKAEVDWEYGGGPGEPGLTSITVGTDQDAHPLLDGRAHIILSPHGKCTHLDADSGAGKNQYIGSRDEPEPGKQWRLAMSRIESFYESSGE